MEIRVVIFLVFTAVTVVSNTFMIWLLYRGFAHLVSETTNAVQEFQKRSTTRAWMDLLQQASEKAVAVTETAKNKVIAYDSCVAEIQAKYEFGLATIDAKLEEAASVVSESARRMQEAVAAPADNFEAIACGVQRMLGFVDLDRDG